MKKIVFTGGGSAGHVTVNLALIPKLKQEGWHVDYIGSHNGIEKELVKQLKDIPYHGVATGKLRRYFDWNNVKDPFNVLLGTFQAYRLIKKLKPDVIFSKGGFVSVPVAVGGWLNKVPVIIHESDMTPGLANKISMRFATKVCVTFPETKQMLQTDKTVHIGAIVREELLRGNATRGLSLCNFTKTKPVLLIMGGSLGSHKINQVIRSNLDTLLSTFQIVHICGKDHVDHNISMHGYKQFAYVNEELPDLLAMTDVVVSRAGSNSIFEFLALQKPMLLIPLSKEASRGDQIVNARSFEKSGYGEVLLEENLSDETFLQAIRELYENKTKYVYNMRESGAEDSITKAINLIKQAAK